MKFTINSRELKPVLDNLSKIAKSKTTLPILDYFKLELTDDELFVTASDMEVSITSVLTPDSVETTGSSCVLADKLYDVVRNFKDEMLTFKLNNTRMTIKSKSGNFYVPVESAENFPLDHSVDSSNIFQIPAHTLVNGIHKTLFAAFDNFEFMPILCGVYLDLSPMGTSLVGADGNRLAVFTDSPVSAEETGVVIPTKMANMIVSTATEEDAYISIMFNEKTIVAVLDKTTIRSRTIEGSYPKYKTIVPSSMDVEAIVDTQAAINALKRVFVFANNKSKVVKLKLTDGLITVLAEDLNFGLSADESIEAAYEGEEVEAWMNGRYLMECLTKMDTERCAIKLNAKAVMIEPEQEIVNYTTLFGQVASFPQ